MQRSGCAARRPAGGPRARIFSALRVTSHRPPPAIVLGNVPPSIIWGLLLPLAVLLLVNALVVGTFRVVGDSMRATLEPGDFLIVSKVAASAASVSGWLGVPAVPAERGDVVVFQLPRNPSLVLVKRVIGIPGDRVEIREGVDDIVPEGAVFVVGDNREPGVSSDSRDWGYLPCRQIIGTAVMRLLPIRRAGLLAVERNP